MVIFVAVCVMFLLAVSAVSLGQNSTPNFGAVNLGYAKMPKVNFNLIQPPSSSIRFVIPKGVTSTRGLFLNDANSSGGGSHKNAPVKSPAGGNIAGLDTVPTFTGAFNSTAPSIDPFQSSDGFRTTSPFTMIGNSPLVGGTTVIPANMTAISLQLLHPDGSAFANVPVAPFEQLILDSPNFRGR